MNNEALVRANISLPEDERDGNLRPQLIHDFLGQTTIKENLSVFIEIGRAHV